MDKYDIAVIGGGPAGYSAAIRAKALGKSVCLIEEAHLGGVCLNEGCIPTKFLINAVKHYQHCRALAHKNIIHGLGELSLSALQHEKQRLVEEFRAGLAQLLKIKKIDVRKGRASFINASTLAVAHDGATQEISCARVIIAAGAQPVYPAHLSPDGKKILSTGQALECRLPWQHLAIIGGGVIGCELASLFSLLGTKVTIIEKETRLLAQEDNDEVSSLLTASLARQGVTLITGTEVLRAEYAGEKLRLSMREREAIESDACVVATGKIPTLGHMNLEKIISIAHGKVKNRGVKTTHKDIFIAGDICGGDLYAYTAYDQGIAAAELASRRRPPREQKEIPSCIFTQPEIAYIGLSEKKARARHIAVTSFKFRYSALGRAKIDGDKDGFVKVVVGARSKKLLGALIVGTQASELINAASLLLHTKASAEDIVSFSCIHPAYFEGLKEAFLGARGFSFPSA